MLYWYVAASLCAPVVVAEIAKIRFPIPTFALSTLCFQKNAFINFPRPIPPFPQIWRFPKGRLRGAADALWCPGARHVFHRKRHVRVRRVEAVRCHLPELHHLRLGRGPPQVQWSTHSKINPSQATVANAVVVVFVVVVVVVLTRQAFLMAA